MFMEMSWSIWIFDRSSHYLALIDLYGLKRKNQWPRNYSSKCRRWTIDQKQDDRDGSVAARAHFTVIDVGSAGVDDIIPCTGKL